MRGYFGAFQNGRMISGMGIFSDGTGAARYQDVQTHPEYRRQGLASWLLHCAGTYALRDLKASRLVIVTDPNGPAINLYRRHGFAGNEIQTRFQHG